MGKKLCDVVFENLSNVSNSEDSICQIELVSLFRTYKNEYMIFDLKEKVTPQDSEYKMISLTMDFMFKSLVIRKPEYLKIFIIDVLKLDLLPEEIELTFVNGELPKDNHLEYKKIVDLLISINNKILLDIVVNRRYYRDVKFRNNRYLGKMLDL